MSPDVARVIQAWRLVPDHEFGPPLATAEIVSAERRLGRPLPTSVVELYGAGNGMSVLGGNLSINALTGDMALPAFRTSYGNGTGRSRPRSWRSG